MSVRITINISDDANKKLRKEQTRQINKTNRGISASKIINDMLLKLR